MGDLVKQLRTINLSHVDAMTPILDAAARIEQLEAQVRAADALADMLAIILRRQTGRPVEVHAKQKLVAYRSIRRATKEGGA